MVRGKLREDPFHGLLGYRDLVRSANIYFIIDFTASMPTQAGNFAIKWMVTLAQVFTAGGKNRSDEKLSDKLCELSRNFQLV